MIDVIVIGGGPAGTVAALRAADLGANTTLVTRDAFGGMAANDGPVSVRTLAHAARMIREAKQLSRYGIASVAPDLDYLKLLKRVGEVVDQVRTHSAFRPQLDAVGVKIHEHAGIARFLDSNTIETGSKLRFHADRIILCAGGISRRLSIPGFELTATHSDAWGLQVIPESMLVVGGGATGIQVASIFNAFGTRVQLFESGSRILRTEDEDVSTAVTAAFRENGVVVHENFGAIDSFEKTANGIKMLFTKDGQRQSAEASLAVLAVGWIADAAALNLAKVGVETDARGYVKVDAHLQTSVAHIYAAGDITGSLMLVPEAIQDGFIAGTNAVLGSTEVRDSRVAPIGSFTDPEYAQVGLTEAKAREGREIVVAKISFDSTTRTIIDGRTTGFCKLIVDRGTREVLGCHIVGERAVEIAQVVSIVIASGMRVDDLARIPLSFPTYAGVIGRLAASATRQLNLPLRSRVNDSDF